MDGCGSRWDDKPTAPSLHARRTNLGCTKCTCNVAEWVQDCWNTGCYGAKTHGGAWGSGDWGRRVWRGGVLAQGREWFAPRNASHPPPIRDPGSLDSGWFHARIEGVARIMAVGTKLVGRRCATAGVSSWWGGPLEVSAKLRGSDRLQSFSTGRSDGGGSERRDQRAGTETNYAK